MLRYCNLEVLKTFSQIYAASFGRFLIVSGRYRGLCHNWLPLHVNYVIHVHVSLNL